MSFHFATPQPTGLGWPWGTNGSPVVTGRGHERGWALQRDGSCVPFGGLGNVHEGFGPEQADPMGPPPDEHKLPAWALVGIVGAVCAVVGVAIYYKYKLTSEIAAKHGIGKALAFEAGTEAIGVVGSRLRR